MSATARGAPRDRDGTTLRRALAAGVLVAVLVGGPLLLAGLVGPDPDRAAVVAAVVGFVAGTFAAALWLLVAVALDLLAGEPPGARRALWTGAAVLVAVTSPFLLLAAGG